jgi:heptose I phosphotransferase
MKETFRQRLMHGVQRVWQRPDWTALAGTDWPDRILEVQVTDDFHAKQGRSTGRWVVQRDGGTLAVYLKRHYRLPWWRGLLAALWPGRAWSPAMQEWQHLQWARDHGFAVPAPAAVVEYVGPWGRLRSALAIEELTGMLPLHQAIPLAAAQLEEASFRRWKHALITELARLTRELHRQRHFHKDLYLCHFYLPRAEIERWLQGRAGDCRGRLHMIDLHRLGHHPVTWPWWQLKDLAQLLYSSEVVGITPRDRVLFWRSYRQGARRRGWARCLERIVRLRWRRYRDHNHKRKRRQAQSLKRRTAA